MLNSVLRSVIDNVIDRALPSAPPLERIAATEELKDKLLPIIENKTNSEPWYQSRVTWGAIVSTASGVLALFGVAISPDNAELIIGMGLAAGTVIGGMITLYGRWVARKPLGQ